MVCCLGTGAVRFRARNEGKAELVFRTIVFLLAALFTAQAAHAATSVNWDDLKDPAAEKFEDPFAALSIQELRSLGLVLNLREQLAKHEVGAETRSGLEQQLRREEAKLAAAGVHTDWLLSHRQEIGEKRAAAALAGNSALAGKDIAIGGYVIPVQAPGKHTVEGGYLVPEAGMCSHMPAPDPNQTIRYRLSTDWNADQVYQPVVLVGRLSLHMTRQEIMLLDGQVEMIAVFDMDVTEVRSPEEPKAGKRLLNFFRRFQAPAQNDGQ